MMNRNETEGSEHDQPASHSAKLLKMLERSGVLRSPPLSACRLAAVADAEGSMEEVVTILKTDPGVTAAILRDGNLLKHGRRFKAERLEDAVSFLGFAEILRIVWRRSLAKYLDAALVSYGMRRGELWHHCVITALSAQEIYRQTGAVSAKETEVFTAALLHDIGKTVMDRELEDGRDQFVRMLLKEDVPITAAEQGLLGVTHAEVGGAILQEWNLSAAVVEGVAKHHAPPEDRVAVSSIVLVANHCAHTLGSSYGISSTSNYTLASVEDLLGLGGVGVDDVMRSVVSRWRDVRKLLHSEGN